MDGVGAGARGAGRLKAGLEARVVAVALISTVTALLAAFAVYQWRNWSADRADLAQDSLQLAQALGAAGHRQIASGGVQAEAEVAGLLYGSEHAVAAVYAEGGRRVQIAKPGHEAAELTLVGAGSPTAVYRGGWLEVRAPFEADGARVGEVVLRVDDDELLQQRLTNIAIALVLSFVATVAAGLVAQRLARRALAPLRGLNAAMAAAAASHDFSARLPIARDDEVGELTRRYNGLLAALEEHEQRRREALDDANAAREAAERAHEMKSQLLSNLSHELRTPLNGVLGMSQALLLDDLSAEQRERVGLILNSGSALKAVLHDLLDLSDMEAGRLALHTAPFDLADVIAEACDTALAMAGTKGLTLAAELDPSAQGLWMGDGARLRQVIYNLVSNGLKFTAAGGVTVHAAAGERGLILTVADTGMGIGPELLPRLFETFTQGEGGKTRRFGGAGVGLSICRKLVDLMGGVLAVESRLGEGSTFTVLLPLERAGAAAAEGEVDGLRVLVAEDNETNQRVVRTVLNALGVDPVLVPDGAAAVEAWGRGVWDLVLMDIQMPVRDGVAATRDIRRLEAERGLAPTPIVALTANTLPAQVDEYAAAGMDGVVPKPIMIEQLQAALVSAQMRRAA